MTDLGLALALVGNRLSLSDGIGLGILTIVGSVLGSKVGHASSTSHLLHHLALQRISSVLVGS
jgi:hypothetical protein